MVSKDQDYQILEKYWNKEQPKINEKLKEIDEKTEEYSFRLDYEGICYYLRQKLSQFDIPFEDALEFESNVEEEKKAQFLVFCDLIVQNIDQKLQDRAAKEYFNFLIG